MISKLFFVISLFLDDLFVRRCGREGGGERQKVDWRVMINEYGMETLFGIIISYYSLARRARLLGCAVELSFVFVPGWLLILSCIIIGSCRI